MTQEEQDLLLRDLCERLPYGVMALADTEKEFNGGIILTLNVVQVDFAARYFYFQGAFTPYTVEEIRPYLRTLGSMTEEEKKQFWELNGWGVHKPIDADPYCVVGFTVRCLDWLKANHFDFRGLIEKGLAIKVTEDNYPYKQIEQ